MKSGSLNFLEPLRPVQASNLIALHITDTMLKIPQISETAGRLVNGKFPTINL
jgi:hypothetical protein